MKYIKIFEKWGISKEVEDSAKYYVQQMLKEPNKKKYTFVYYSEKGDYNLDIIIDKFKDKNQYGEFTYSDDENSENKTSGYYIKITRRDDIKTLIHELKHFDRLLRKGPNTDMLSVGTIKMDDLKLSDLVKQIFYLFNTDEYEARYHEYYYGIDKYLSENLKENPNSKDVISMINFYLESVVSDKSYKLWKIDFNIDILRNSTKKELIKVFNKILDNKPFLPRINFNNIKGTYKALVRFIKSEIGMEVTPENFDKLVKKLNLQINRNREKFRKKFNRLYTIMIDKYVK
jgi:hypothetical protein